MKLKPHIEFFLFDDTLALVVPTATMLISKGMISLETFESYMQPPWELSLNTF